MIGQTSPRSQVGCLTLMVASILGISYLATASFNPVGVYVAPGILAKVAVSVLLIAFAAMLVQLIQFYFLIKHIEWTTGRNWKDVICPADGLPLIQHMGAYGLPIQCPNSECRKWWHNGPACYNKDMPRPRIMIPTYPCPDCRATAASYQDLFDAREFPPFT